MSDMHHSKFLNDPSRERKNFCGCLRLKRVEVHHYHLKVSGEVEELP